MAAIVRLVPFCIGFVLWAIMTPLVSVSWLQENLHNPNLRIVDCRFSLQDSLADHYCLAHTFMSQFDNPINPHLQSFL
jgi:hypothetical protein